MGKPTLSFTFWLLVATLCVAGKSAVAQPFAYISSQETRSITVVDTASDTVVDKINFEGLAYPVTIDPAGTTFYISSGGSCGRCISVIDTATNTLVDEIAVERIPSGLVTSPDGAKLYSGNNDSSSFKAAVTVIDTATGTIDTVIDMPPSSFGNQINPRMMTVTPDGQTLYVNDFTNARVVLIDTTNNTVAGEIAVNNCPLGMDMTADGSTVYVVNFCTHSVSVIDTSSNTVVDTVFQVGERSFFGAVTPDGSTLYVTNIITDHSVTVINTATNAIVDTIAVGNDPEGISITPDGKKVYVTNKNSDSVSVIDTGTNTVVTTIEGIVAPNPGGKFIAPGVAAHQINITSGPQGTPNPVASGGGVQLDVTAVDTEGHALNHLWSADCSGWTEDNGALDDPKLRQPVWTAPDNGSGDPKECQITVTLSDGEGLSKSASFTQRVAEVPHTLTITEGPEGDPNPVETRGAVNLNVAAEDNRGHAVNYNWGTDCQDSSFDDPTLQRPVWTAPPNNSGSTLQCTIIVHINDGDGGLIVQETFIQSVTSGPTGPGILEVTPPGGTQFWGTVGGPFWRPISGGFILLPPTADYTLENTGGQPITASARRNPLEQDWVSLTIEGSGCSGGFVCIFTLNPQDSRTITVSVNDNANILPLGDHAVDVVFENNSNHSGDTSRTMNLEVVPADDVPPVVTPPPDLIIEAEGPLTEVDLEQNGPATALDNLDGAIDPQPFLGGISKPNPDFYGVGETFIEWRATDSSGNTGNAFQKVTVQDTTPPELTVPDVTEIFVTSAPAHLQLSAFGTPVVNDLADPNPEIRVLLFPENGNFDLGETSIIWIAEDFSGNRVAKVQTVTILLRTTELAAMEVIQSIQDLRNTVVLIRDKTTYVRAYFRPAVITSQTLTVKPRLRAFHHGTELPGGPLLPDNPGAEIEARADILNLRRTLQDPADLEELAANFLLPFGWARDNVVFQLEFEKDEYEVIECDNSVSNVNEQCELEPQVFFHAPTFDVKLVKIEHWTEATPSALIGFDCDGRYVRTTNTEVNNIVRRLYSNLPINNVKFERGVMSFGCVLGEPARWRVNMALLDMKLLEGCPTALCNTLYYGIIHPSHSENGGLSTDLGYDQAACGVAKDSGYSPPPNDGIFDRRLGYMRGVAIHELAHSMEVPHPYWTTLTSDINDDLEDGDEIGACGADADEDEPIFPYITVGPPDVQASVFSTTNNRIPGRRPFTRTGSQVPGGQVASIGPMGGPDASVIIGYDSDLDRFISPNSNFELMSYCGPGFKWPSKYTYDILLDEICNQFTGPCRFDTSSASTANLTPESQRVQRTSKHTPSPYRTNVQSRHRHAGDHEVMVHDSPAPYSVIQGVVVASTGEVILEPVWTLPELDTVPVFPPTGEYEIHLFDAPGNSLGQFAFEPHFVREDPTRKFMDAPFVVPVPHDPDLYEIRVMNDGQIMTSMIASEHPPTVRITAPSPGEKVVGDRFTVKWKGADKDKDRLTYNIQYSRDGGITWKSLATNYSLSSLEVETRTIGQTQNGLVRVEASDGLRTASDVTKSPFSTPNSRPHVLILTPQAHDIFFGEQTLVFKAISDDIEDGTLTDSSIDWTSDIDGVIGQGHNFMLLASALTPGRHRVTLRGQDSAGGIGTDSVEIQVFGPEFPSLVVAQVDTYPETIRPANHKMVPVSVDVDVQKLLSVDEPECRIVSITSNESDNGAGDGNTVGDSVITGSLTAEVRAERSGTGSSRIYSINVECSAMEGDVQHIATGTGTVTVPHNR